MFSFYGVEQHLLRPDRFYKVHVTDRGLYGAYLAGQVYDDESAEHFLRSMYIIALFFERWAARRTQQRWLREKQYRHLPTSDHALDTGKDTFLKKDRRNFFIAAEKICSVDLRTKKRSLLRRYPVAGEIEFRLRNSSLTLVLPADQSLKAVYDQFARGEFKAKLQSLSGLRD